MPNGLATMEIAIYQDIDSATGYGPQMMRDALALAGGAPVRIRLNSQGGNVIDGLAIHNLLKAYPAEKTVIIDGMALSIASVIAMAGDRVEIAENSWMMIHNPNNEAAGDGDAMRDMATLLDGMRDQLAGIYAAKSGKTPDECRALMAAETWMTGPQAVESGFADIVTASLAVAAAVDTRRFTNFPKEIDTMAVATYQDLKKAFPRAKADFIVRCMDRNLDIEKARAEFDEDMVKALEETTEELAKAKAELEEMKEAQAKAKAEEELTKEEEVAAKAKAKAEEDEEAEAKAKARAKAGVRPVAGKGGSRSGQSATAEWHDAIAEKMKTGLPKARATRAIVLERPELHRAFLTEVNSR